MTSLGDPPKPSELEISLFGPGYGESVALHAGLGDWIIVDSCLDGEEAPAALEYLDLLGVDPRQAVKVVVATHWHDDHVSGLSEIVECSESAAFWASMSLRQEEFRRLVSLPSSQFMTGKTTSGVEELSNVVQILQDRNRRPNFAVANLPIWNPSRSVDATIYSLSPSQAMIQRALMGFGQLLPEPGEPKRRVPDIGPNSTSVVLWLEVGTRRVLLGSDLEETGDPEEGWSAIVASDRRPPGQALICKIPHHGSASSHCEGMWEELLVEGPVSALTPFSLGGTHLPKSSDISRIVTRSSRAYLTAPRGPEKVKFRGAAKRSVEESTRWIRYAESRCGHVRFRLGLESDEPPTAECFHGAHRLREAS